HFLRLARTFLAVIAVGPAILAHAQLPSGSGVGIAAETTANSANVALTDPGDHTWVLQSSSNLSTWTNMETLKVHNGRFQRNASWNAGTPGLFYRAVYNPSAQTLTSTLANALLLSPTPANYANPTLPP